MAHNVGHRRLMMADYEPDEDDDDDHYDDHYDDDA